jgi:hypothetical protein
MIFSCSSKEPKDTTSKPPLDKEQTEKTELNEDKTKSDDSKNKQDQTYNLGTKDILFIIPDSSEINKLELDYGEKIKSIVETQDFALSEAKLFIEMKGMPYDITTKRYVKYKLNHSWNHTDHPVKDVLIDTDTIDSKWLVIMHDGYIPAVVSTYSDIEENFLKLSE